MKSGSSSMQADSDIEDGNYSDSCDYDEYNEGLFISLNILSRNNSIHSFLEEIYGVDEGKPKELPECSHVSSDSEVVSYDCLTVSEVETMVNNWVAEVTEMLSITPSQAKLLLQLNNWDIDLIKKEASGTNKEEFLVKNGLKAKEKRPAKTERRLGMELRSKIAKKDSKKPPSCGVCWEEDAELMSLDCGHSFCDDCWPNFIKTQVEESKSLSFSCFL